MVRFKRIGVFLNQEPGDDEAISFAGCIACAASAETISFTVVRGLESAPSETAPDITEIHARILRILPDADKHQVEISSATGVYEILRVSRDLDLDLIVVGRRLPNDQLAAGSVFYRVARKAPCSVLLTPEYARTHLSRLLVMVDFSEHSRLALETALVIARACGESTPQVLVHSTYRVGYGYRYSGMNFDEAAASLKKQTADKLAAFLTGLDTSGLQFETVVACAESATAAAMNLATARNMDAVVLGSRGMTRPAAVLLGSTTEQMVASAPLPVLIVKRKGETTRFVDALLSDGGDR